MLEILNEPAEVLRSKSFAGEFRSSYTRPSF